MTWTNECRGLFNSTVSVTILAESSEKKNEFLYGQYEVQRPHNRYERVGLVTAFSLNSPT